MSVFREEDIIDSYTDNEAVNDGIIHQLAIQTEIGFLQSTINRITDNALNGIKEYYDKKGIKRTEEEWLIILEREIKDKARKILEADKRSSFYTTNFEFVEIEEGKNPCLWFVLNEVGGVTIMKPEDY